MHKQALWYVTSETYNGCQYILIIAIHAHWENFSAHTHKTESQAQFMYISIISHQENCTGLPYQHVFAPFLWSS